MYIRKLYIAVWTINFALVGMCGYVWGVYDGLNTVRNTVDPVAIRYAVYQAMQND